ncbi:hypothetical protein, partial [Enterococcus faecalis]
LNRLYQAFNSFVARHLHVAFNADPEQALASIRDKRSQIVRSLAELDSKEQQQRSQLLQSKQALGALDKLAPMVRILEDETLAERLAELEVQLER